MTDVECYIRGEIQDLGGATKANAHVEEELERLTRRSASAWKDVADPTAWVDELRGGKH